MLRNISLLSLAFAVTTSAVIAQGPPPPLPPLPPTPVPAGNPITTAKANLGKVLFWDEQLSSNNTMACGTCHVLARGGSDPRTNAANTQSRAPGLDGLMGTPDDILGSSGVSRSASNGAYLLAPFFRLEKQVTTRKAPSVINAGFPPLLFWDGRASNTFTDPITNAVVLPGGAALESQVMGPAVSDVEMAHVGRDWNQVAAKIAASQPLRLAPQIPAALSTWIAGRPYGDLFLEAFGSTAVTPVRIGEAIATYERTLYSNQAPILPLTVGAPPPVLTTLEAQGQAIFTGPGRCVVCHAGPRFTNDSFRYIGVRPPNEDLGRFVVTNTAGDQARMKVPSLLNVELRAPYFHNGEMATLDDVVAFYNRGGDFNAPNKDPAIAPIGLSLQQQSALVAFLKRPLTDVRVALESAPFDHPTLFSASTRVAQHFGSGTLGAGTFVPRMIADQPAAVGNTQFTIALDGANAGRHAFLLFSPTGSTQPTPFQGANLYLSTTGFTFVRIGATQGSGPGQGFGSATISIPNNPALVGQTFFAQWLVLDQTAGGRFSASEPISATYF